MTALLHHKKFTRLVSIAFFIIISALLGVAGFALYFTHRAADRLERVVSTNNVKIEIHHQFLRLARERSLSLQAMLLRADPFEVDQYTTQISAIASEYLILRGKLLELEIAADERLLIEDQHQSSVQTSMIQSQVMALGVAEQWDEARSLLFAEAIPLQVLAMDKMQAFIDYQDQKNKTLLSTASRDIAAETFALFIFASLGGLVSMLVASNVLRRLQAEFEHRNHFELELEALVEERTAELMYLASHDKLTALPNRHAFPRKLEQMLTNTAPQHLTALFFMDLDGFKQINDQYGHEAGDAVLVATAARFSAVSADVECLARMGGDEFTLILPNITQVEQATALAAAIIEQTRQPVEVNGQLCQIGVSIGISLYPRDAHLPDDLLRIADDLMYEAKARGKNCYTVKSAPASD